MQIELLQNMQLSDYVVFFDHVQKKFIGNYPEDWQAEYLKQSLYKQDVAVINADDTFKPSLWNVSQKKALNKRQRKIMEMAQDYNISAGVTIPNFERNKFLTFAFKSQKNLDIETYKFVILSILMFVQYANKAISRDSFCHYLVGLTHKLKNQGNINNEILQELNNIRLLNLSLHRADFKGVIDRTVLQSLTLLDQSIKI